MRILFDQGVPRGLAWTLREHEVTEARKFGWEKVTTDKNLRYQHQIESRAFRLPRKAQFARRYQHPFPPTAALGTGEP